MIMTEYICEGYSTRAHVHVWLDVTSCMDRRRHLICGSCPATKTEPPDG